MNKLTKLKPNQTKYVNGYIKTGNGTKSAMKAYGIKNPKVAAVTSSRLLNNVNVQQAIDAALALNDLTPELAVSELKKIVMQDKEIGAKRLAIRDTLELHGWRKDERATIGLTVNQFFGKARE